MVARYLRGVLLGETELAECAIGSGAVLPVLELEHSQPVTDPSVEPREQGRLLLKPEVFPPAKQVRPQFLDHSRDASASGPARDGPDTLFHRLQGFAGDAASEFACFLEYPEGIPKKLAFPGAGYSALRFVDSEPEIGKKTPESCKLCR